MDMTHVTAGDEVEPPKIDMKLINVKRRKDNVMHMYNNNLYKRIWMDDGCKFHPFDSKIHDWGLCDGRLSNYYHAN